MNDDDIDIPIEECFEELTDKAYELVSVADDYSLGCIVLAWQKPEPGQAEQITIKTSELSDDERNRILIQVAMSLDSDVRKALLEMMSRAAKRPQWPMGMYPSPRLME